MLTHDWKRAVRALRRSPGYAVVAVLTLALGIGANTAIFSVVNTVLFRPLPVDGIERLVVVRSDLPGLGLHGTPLAPPEVFDLAARRDAFQAVTGLQETDVTLTGHGAPMRVSTTVTLGDFAGVFGVTPHLGRFYPPEVSTDGPHRIAVVSHGLWQQLSGGDASFVGSTLLLDGIAHEVVGVMPPDFRYPRQAQLWIPFQYTDRWTGPDARGRLMMTLVGRPRAGIAAAQLDAYLRTEESRWNELYAPGSEYAKVLTATPFPAYLAGPLRPILLVLMGAVVFVLMIAAANVASLQLVRSAARGREIAVRAAIGAGRVRIARELLAESVFLAALGGVLGLGIGALGLRLLGRWEPAGQMGLAAIRLDATVLAFTALVSLAAAAAFGVLPALRAARVQPQEALRESGRGASLGRGQNRLLRGGVVVQVMLALALLLGSALMIRTLSRMLATDPGFAPRDLTTAQLSVSGGSYDTPERRAAFFDAVLERVRAHPGVESAAMVWGLPFTDQGDSSPFEIIGRPARAGDPERHAEARVVGPGYFATMRIPLLQGRDFDATDRLDAPGVALIDQTFAEQFFAGEDPVGRQIRGYTGDPVTIVGVVGRVHHDEVGDAPKAVAYYPFAQQPWWDWRSIVVRSSRPVGEVASMLRGAVAELDPAVPVYDVQSMEGRIERSLGPRRLAMLALGGFAALSLLLSALGVYGVMRYSTGQRTREIGIRMAMGAQPRDVAGMVIRQGMAITATGLALGVPVAFALTRLMGSLLYGVGPHDPASFLAAAALLSVVSLAATWLPARHATRVDPNTVLRAE